MMLLLWRGVASTTVKRFWITAIQKNALCDCGFGGRCTMDAIWKVVQWNLEALAARSFPHTGPEGEALEDDWRREKAGTPLTLRAGCVQFRGDWPWLCFVFGFLGHAATQFCFMCAAAFNEHTPMTDVSVGARWRAR